MFSRNRYGKRAWLEYMAVDDVDYINSNFSTMINDIDLAINSNGLIQQFPLPKVEEYYKDDKFYSEHVVGDEWFAKERREYHQGLWNPYFDYLISRMKPELPLVDVGCGAGWFIDYWIRKGNTHFVAYGIEPSEQAFLNAPRFAKGSMYASFEDFVAMLDGMNERSDSYNVLMSLTLEHIPNPVSFIQQYLPYVGKEGTLTIVVPNDFSPLQRWIGSTHFIQDVHVNYFTPYSLENVIYDALPESKHPMKYKLFMSATFPMELFEVFGIHYIGNSSLGSKCHKFRLLFEKFLQKRAFSLYEKLFDKYGWGRELIYTVKPIGSST